MCCVRTGIGSLPSVWEGEAFGPDIPAAFTTKASVDITKRSSCGKRT